MKARIRRNLSKGWKKNSPMKLRRFRSSKKVNR